MSRVFFTRFFFLYFYRIFLSCEKDNNILWSGGRKDDITVIVARVKRALNVGGGSGNTTVAATTTVHNA
jgi:hypothetical protein